MKFYHSRLTGSATIQVWVKTSNGLIHGDVFMVLRSGETIKLEGVMVPPEPRPQLAFD
ncbi:hypothetical protein HQ571_00920 [Candidatus Kuenenbacteria bacterium]|nr:hypothetical protein [Candidatus Kuenenbacteria bacterium]